MKYKILFFDIDGTLVSFQTHRVPESTIKAIHEVRQKGYKVYIATGRPNLLIDNLGELEYDGMVTTTGAYCLDASGKPFEQSYIDEEDVNRVVRYLEQAGDQAFPVFFVTEDELFINRVTPEVEEINRLLNLHQPPVCPPSYALGKKILQMIAFFPPEMEQQYMTGLMPNCVAMRWHPYFVDIITRGVSKSYGIDCVLKREGLTPQEAIAFGDGGNDIDMLRHVGMGIAMGNAGEAVQAAADYVTASVDEDGIYRALVHLGILNSDK